MAFTESRADVIPNRLRAKAMRYRMEDKNLLKHKGSFYVGKASIPEEEGTDESYETQELVGPNEATDNGKTLVADSATDQGWKIDQIGTEGIKKDAVTGDKISSSSSVDNSRAIGTNHIKDGAITESKIGTGAVTEDKLAVGFKDPIRKDFDTTYTEKTSLADNDLFAIQDSADTGTPKLNKKVKVSTLKTVKVNSAGSADTSTTQAQTDNSTKIATTAYVRTAVSNFYGSGSLSVPSSLSSSTNIIKRQGNLVYFMVEGTVPKDAATYEFVVPDYCTSGNTLLRLKPTSYDEAPLINNCIYDSYSSPTWTYRQGWYDTGYPSYQVYYGKIVISVGNATGVHTIKIRGFYEFV